ncbi:MAG TPA: SPOR domain-containing protein [Gammaproteobacteria bacterium]
MAQRSSSRKPRSSGASRRGGSRRGGSGVPGWVWLVTGVLAGLFAAFLVFLVRFDFSAPAASADKGKPASEAKAHGSKERAPAAATAKSKPPAEKPPAKAEKREKVEVATAKPASSKKAVEPPAKPAVNYDFYKILPQYEVVVPEEEARQPVTATPGTYYLQVGAFRKLQEADGRKAELAMLGFVSTIQTVTVDKENTWHRVRIGPVKDMRQLDRTKRQLQDHNIAFVTLREKS